MNKLIRITTVPLSLEKLLEGQLRFMNKYFHVTAISAEGERLERYGYNNGIATHHVELTREITPFADLQGLFKLYSFFKKERPLMVHTHTPKAGIVGMLAAKLAGVPLRLHTVAGMPLMETTGVKRQILEQVEKLTYSSATHIYPNSKGLEQFILKEGFATGQKLKVLGRGSSNGIDTQYFNPNLYTHNDKILLKNKLGIPQDDLVYVFVGRIVGDKGINELVEAFLELCHTRPNISLLLVGPFEAQLDPIRETLAIKMRTHPKIITVGYTPDVRPYFAISDVLCFPSYREGFPNVVMQAGAMNLPCIVSNINGCNEIIKDRVNGLIIPVKNKSALRDAMDKLLLNNSLRLSMIKTARGVITSNYERSFFWSCLLEEYQTLETQVLPASFRQSSSQKVF